MNAQEVAGIVAAAGKAAVEAGGWYFREVMGGKDGDCCGFAWVEISGARGNVAKALVSAGFHRSRDIVGHIVLAKTFPDGQPTQGLTCKEKAQEAAAAVLEKAGFEVFTNSRMD